MDKRTSTLSDSSPSGSNGAGDPAKLRAEIAQTRNEMSGTIEQLHGRLNPVVLKEQAIEQFHEATETVKRELKERLQDAKEALMAEVKEVKETVRVDALEQIDIVKSRVSDEIGQAKAAVREATIGKVENMIEGAQDRVRSVREVVAENPIPAALAGVGLAWLFIEGRRRRASRPQEGARLGPRMLTGGERGEERPIRGQVRDLGQQAGRKVADAAHEAVSTASQVAQGAKESVSDLAQEAKESVTDVAHRARDKATELSRGAGHQARRIQRRGNELYRTNPIAVGAALLAAGTIVGLAVPRTNVEDELLGGARDDVVGKAQELAHQAFEKAGDAVKNVGQGDETKREESTRDLGHEFH